MSIMWVRVLFFVAAAYDFVIGATFLGFGPDLFRWAEVPQPNHWAYIQFASLLLMIFGVMFLMVALRPYSNKSLIPYGVMLKASYVGVAGYYWFGTESGIPMLFKPFAVIDAIMLVLFLMAYGSLGRRQG